MTQQCVIYLARCSEIDDSVFKIMLAHVCPARQKRAAHYYHRLDAIRCVYGEVLLQYGLSKMLGYKSNGLKFYSNDYGKPYLADMKIFFNISHSGEWVGCAIADREIGLDIEKIDSKIEMVIAKRYFYPTEICDIFSKPSSERVTRFFHYWTAKESYIKCIGKGLSEPLNIFCIQGNKVTGVSEDEGLYHLYFSDDIPEYKLAICTHNSPQTPTLVIVSYQTIAAFVSNVIAGV